MQPTVTSGKITDEDTSDKGDYDSVKVKVEKGAVAITDLATVLNLNVNGLSIRDLKAVCSRNL